MAGLINLDTNKLQESIGVLEECTNVVVLEVFSDLAEKLKNTGDDNRVTQELLEQCRNFQNSYNLYVESVENSLNDLGQVVELSEYHAKKASVGEVKQKDLSFKNEKIDVRGALQG